MTPRLDRIAARIMRKTKGWGGSDQRGNIRARVHELRNMGLLTELGKRKCTVTGMTVLLYDVTDKVPQKTARPERIECPHCGGKGYVEQGRLF